MKKIVILHGWNSRPEKWEIVKRELENSRWQVWAPALPGFSHSLRRSWNLDDYVAWLTKWLREKKITRPWLLGHSFGGRIAIKLAVKNPRLLRGLILVDAAGIKDKSWRARFKRNFFKKLARIGRRWRHFNILRRLLYFLIREQDYYLASGFLRQTMSRIVAEDLEPLLEKISLPTLIIWGRQDSITPLWMARIMRAKIKKSRLKIINCGHSPHLQAPQKLARLIKQNCGSLK